MDPNTIRVLEFDYSACQDQTDDLCATRRATEAYEAWKQDPGRAKPWEEIEAELVAEGLLDE